MVKLSLGDFVFQDTEIPEQIAFGGRQSVAVHELVGGQRVVDAMGRQDKPMEWSGLMRGQSAMSRARQLDQMRIDGKQILLTWHTLAFQVVVVEFQADFQRFYQIPYHIVCLPVQQQTAAVSQGADALIAQDMVTANTLTSQVNDGTLTGLMGTLNTAVSSVSSFATATQGTINGVLGPLRNAQSQVDTLITAGTNTIQSVTTLGGILPNNPISIQASRLTSQVAAMTQSPELVNLRNVLGRMGTNMTSINGGVNSITTAGGNLYNIAAKAYGDATAWTGIARANNLTDPSITGVQTINIPANADQADGVLNA